MKILSYDNKIIHNYSMFQVRNISNLSAEVKQKGFAFIYRILHIIIAFF